MKFLLKFIENLLKNLFSVSPKFFHNFSQDFQIFFCKISPKFSENYFEFSPKILDCKFLLSSISSQLFQSFIITDNNLKRLLWWLLVKVHCARDDRYNDRSMIVVQWWSLNNHRNSSLAQRTFTILQWRICWIFTRWYSQSLSEIVQIKTLENVEK